MCPEKFHESIPASPVAFGGAVGRAWHIHVDEEAEEVAWYGQGIRRNAAEAPSRRNLEARGVSD